MEEIVGTSSSEDIFSSSIAAAKMWQVTMSLKNHHTR